MNTRALRVLEFEKIREQLSLFAQSDAGKALCLKLIPAGDRTEVEERLAETEEAVVILTYHGANPISSFRDVTEWLSLAEKGSTLSPRALLDIAEVLRVSAAVRASLVTERENTPRITGEASLLQPLKTLQQDISDAILSEDEISDRASPELADIRRRIRQTNDRVRDRLNQMAHGTAFAKYLMEPIITMRSGRYVLPVKQEYRQAVPGLVHDQSATGATLYIEPMAVVEMGNELREWELKEKKEIERILAALSAQAGDSAALIRGNLNVLSHLDFVFARGALARSMDAVSPRLNGEGRIRLLRARHPLIPADRVVPLTLWLGDDFTTLVITGPNTGGKTVTLKTVGLFALMVILAVHSATLSGAKEGIGTKPCGPCAVCGEGRPASAGTCAACGFAFPEGTEYNYCPICGKKRPAAACGACGFAFPEGSEYNYCPICGEPAK